MFRFLISNLYRHLGYFSSKMVSKGMEKLGSTQQRQQNRDSSLKVTVTGRSRNLHCKTTNLSPSFLRQLWNLLTRQAARKPAQLWQEASNPERIFCRGRQGENFKEVCLSSSAKKIFWMLGLLMGKAQGLDTTKMIMWGSVLSQPFTQVVL